MLLETLLQTFRCCTVLHYSELEQSHEHRESKAMTFVTHPRRAFTSATNDRKGIGHVRHYCQYAIIGRYIRLLYCLQRLSHCLDLDYSCSQAAFTYQSLNNKKQQHLRAQTYFFDTPSAQSSEAYALSLFLLSLNTSVS